MKRLFAMSIISMGLVSCLHEKTGGRQEPRTLWGQDPIKTWIVYQAELEQMSSRDLRQEVERLRRLSPEAKTDDAELKLALAQAAQHVSGGAYQKALESIQTQITRGEADGATKLWLKQYSQQLAVTAQLERELSEEKKHRQEIEKKMKALSDIELEMREREKSDVVR